MTKKHTKFIKIGFILLTVIFLSGSFALSVFSRSLEIDYPKLMEIRPEETSIPLPEYITYIFNFALWIVGILAFGVLAFAGIKYLTSAGSPSLQKDAKDQISSALMGIIILLLSVLFLNEINPELLILSEPSVSSPGQSASNFVFAQNNGDGRDLEIDYPDIAGADTPDKVSTPLGEYIKYIFSFALWIVGILAFGVLVIAGVKYLISGENPKLKADARNQILCAILGVLILISSITVLNQIKFDSAVISPYEIDPAILIRSGIWLCKEPIGGFVSFMQGSSNLDEDAEDEMLEKIKENCYRLLAKSLVAEEFKGKIKQVYLIPDENEDYKYGLVMHKGEGFDGDCVTATEDKNLTSFEFYSVTPFIIETHAEGEGISIYDHRDFNENLEPNEVGEKEEDIKADRTVKMNPCYSIKIDKKENWVAIAYGSPEASWSVGQIEIGSIDNAKPCEVFDRSDRNLEDDFVGTFCSQGFWWWNRQPCIEALQIFKGKIITGD